MTNFNREQFNRAENLRDYKVEPAGERFELYPFEGDGSDPVQESMEYADNELNGVQEGRQLEAVNFEDRGTLVVGETMAVMGHEGMVNFDGSVSPKPGLVSVKEYERDVRENGHDAVAREYFNPFNGDDVALLNARMEWEAEGAEEMEREDRNYSEWEFYGAYVPGVQAQLAA